MLKIAALFAASTLLTACQFPQAGGASANEVGQFTIIQAGRRTMLLDTQNGRAWELLETQNGASRGWAQIQSL